MHFHQIPNAALSKENDRPMMQKEVYPVTAALQQYLERYKKDKVLPLAYTELLHYDYSNAIKNKDGKHTHWERVVYPKNLEEQLYRKILALYQLLSNHGHLPVKIDSIDFCEFANSMPFRVNLLNTADNSTGYFYIKSADASRIYGLELEQLLTGNTVNFLYHRQTLVETHIDGMAGDDFLTGTPHLMPAARKMLAAAFVQFNESCFARLLGDMRSYNFVVTHHERPEHFVLKPIDFDQQCYEGRLNLYLPQFYKENLGYLQLVTEALSADQIEQLRLQARQQLCRYAIENAEQLTALLHVLVNAEISEHYKVLSLRKELAAYHHQPRFAHCNSMGSLVKEQLKQLLQPYLPAGTPLFAEDTAGTTRRQPHEPI